MLSLVKYWNADPFFCNHFKGESCNEIVIRKFNLMFVFITYLFDFTNIHLNSVENL